MIDTEILTEIEQKKLLEMVTNHLNNNINKYANEWKLLFGGSRDGYERDEFYKKCNHKENTICIFNHHKEMYLVVLPH